MEYNTQRPQMRISEYGRLVQRMIDAIKNIKDKKERTDAAMHVVQTMAQLNPQAKDQAEFKQKLWDHLYIMAGYDLDIEAPYPMPDPNKAHQKPEKPHYPATNIRYKHYGKILENLVDRANYIEEGEIKAAAVYTIANQMKKSYLLWNRDSVTDEIIAGELRKFSNGKLQMAEDLKLSHPNDAPPAPKEQRSGKKKKNKRFKRKF